MRYPCMNCTERSQGCHSHCERYQKVKYSEICKKAKVNKAKNLDRMFTEMIQERNPDRRVER